MQLLDLDQISSKVAIRAVLQSLLFVFTLDALIAYLGMAE
jgi:hypothetical protein